MRWQPMPGWGYRWQPKPGWEHLRNPRWETRRRKRNKLMKRHFRGSKHSRATRLQVFYCSDYQLKCMFTDSQAIRHDPKSIRFWHSVMSSGAKSSQTFAHDVFCHHCIPTRACTCTSIPYCFSALIMLRVFCEVTFQMRVAVAISTALQPCDKC